MGHVRNYTIGDVIARYKYLNGYNVLHPMGWDLLDYLQKMHQNKTIHILEDGLIKCIHENATKTIRLSIDWDREISTCDEEYYKHQQSLFIDFYNKGLVSRKETYVNWDPVEKTVLANEQVVNGRGWRSNAVVQRKKLSQWFFNITKFSDDLLSDLESLKGWPDKVKLMQKNWIGKSFGCEINFQMDSQDGEINVFTTRPDTIFGASFIALSVDHYLSEKFLKDQKFLKFKEECNKFGTTEEALANAEKLGFETNIFVKHPFIKKKTLPVYFANFVLMDYGSGAIFVLLRPKRFDFAKKYELKISEVVSDVNKKIIKEAYTGNGKLINSSFLNDLDIQSAKEKIISQIEEGLGKRKNLYRLKD